MRICGQRVRDHIRLLWPMFVFVAAVWLLRLLLGLVGAPAAAVRFISVSGASAIAVIFATMRIHARRFGAYANVVMASLLLAVWAQLLVVLAIVFSTITGLENVYTAPEFSVPNDNKYHLRHIFGHLTFGIGATTLMGAAMGCLVFYILLRIMPDGSRSGMEHR